MKMVLVYGVYDLTHYGHYRLFKKLCEDGYSVVVGVVSDEFASTYKPRPILNQDERLENVSHCKWVTRSFLSSSKFEDEAELILPAVIAHGSDWEEDAYKKHMGYSDEFLARLGIEMVTRPYTKGVSTTELINRIRE